MKIAVISANFGGFDKKTPHVAQSTNCDFYHFDENNFPLRHNALTPRLQARLVKMFMWQLVPDYDYYIWVDASCHLSHEDSVKWFLEHCEGVHMAVFKHPHRDTVQEEADYLKKRLAMNCPYITPRYEHELIDEQLAHVSPDDRLYASTAFIMRNDHRVYRAMKEWWHHTSRFHLIDQLSLPYAIRWLEFQVIPDNYLKVPYLEYTRNK